MHCEMRFSSPPHPPRTCRGNKEEKYKSSSTLSLHQLHMVPSHVAMCQKVRDINKRAIALHTVSVMTVLMVDIN